MDLGAVPPGGVWRWEVGAVVAFSVVSCSRAQPSTPGCCDKGETGGRASPETNEQRELRLGSRFRREDGCARDFKSSGEAARDLVELGRLCGQGMAPLLTDAMTGSAPPGGTVEATFRVTGSSACLRAGTVASGGGLSLSLLNQRGELLAGSSSTESLTVAPVDGTVCVREPGAYRAVVRVAPTASATSTLTIQVWQAARD